MFALYTDDSCIIRESLTIDVKQRKISIVANLTLKKRNVCKLDSEKRKCVNWTRKYKMGMKKIRRETRHHITFLKLAEQSLFKMCELENREKCCISFSSLRRSKLVEDRVLL